MKQEFNLDLEQSRMFIKYFMAAMKEPENPTLLSNNSERFEDGYFLNEHSVTFEIAGEKIFVNWLIKFNSDNTISSIANLNNVGNAEFELKISGFLNNVLQNVISLNRKHFFSKERLSCVFGYKFHGRILVARCEVCSADS